MDIDVLQKTLEQANLASIGIGFLAGFLFSFNPVALAAIPVSLAYVTRAHETRKAVLFGGMFILGMVLTHTVLGLITGLGGQWAQKVLGREWGLILGPLLVLLGLMWPGWIKVPLPAIPIQVKRAGGMWGAFALGVPFAVAVCPFCTPALLILLGVSAGLGSPFFGMTLLTSFAFGRAVPILAGAVAVGWLETLKVLSHSQKAFEIAGGVLLILAGLYMLNAYFIVIPELAL
ncbi:MAG: cytochrome C biogenesis protein [Betaproteobacteria bacterium]|nr:MAG: cytochrome C biogenesis protein [Betaproteobacteria bacterium]